MTLNSTRYFSNSIVGTPLVGADINIYETHAVPKYNVGFGFTRADGNMYRYGYANAGIANGLLVAPTFASAGLATLDNSVVVPASAVLPAGEIIYPGRVGSRYVEVTTTATANQYSGGYFITEDGSGEGYSYRIKGNTATGNPATGNIRIELYELIKANVSDDTDITIVPNLWNDVVVADPSTNVMVAGASCSTTTSTKPYGWFCTKGVCAIKQTGTIVLGQGVQLSVVGNGCVATWGMQYTTLSSILGVAQVGVCMAVGADTEYATIKLKLE